MKLEGRKKLTDLQRAQEKGIAPWKQVFIDTKDYIVFVDGFPVTRGHLLFVPKTNNLETIYECYRAAHRTGNAKITAKKWDGFNVGMNIGAAAGQTVMYPHIHLIPRRKGDCDSPEGGIRHVIPSRGYYHAKDS